MISRIWRNTHFLLAISISLFLIIASISGVILGIEALIDQTKPQAIYSLESQSLKKTMEALEDRFEDVYEIVVTEKKFVIVQGITSNGFETFYVDPKTGVKIKNVSPSNPFFNQVRSLHRSLFLKNTGRILVGIVAFLLVLLSITGVILLVKRLGGVMHFFLPLKENNKYRKFHITLGKWFFIPLVIIGISGAYLVIERFDAFSKKAPNIKKYETGEKKLNLNTLYLSDIKRVSYPFSNLKNDIYTIELKDRKVSIRQGDFSLVDDEIFHVHQILKNWSYYIHTGESNVFIAFILTLSSLALIFFVISGLKISSKTSWNLLTPNSNNNKEAHIIILYGSETGNSFEFAKKLTKALRREKHSVGLTTLNNYCVFPKAKKLLVLTSTYGDGEAPFNANDFERLFADLVQPYPIDYSILGFGSKSYPKYCQFAITLETLFKKNLNFNELTPLFKINNQSETDYLIWEKIIINKLKTS